MFRFEIGQQVRVITHPAQAGLVVARWGGEEMGDPYRENIYEVSSFVTKQRESSLIPPAEYERNSKPAGDAH